mgnify:CR=1 FL=1
MGRRGFILVIAALVHCADLTLRGETSTISFPDNDASITASCTSSKPSVVLIDLPVFGEGGYVPEGKKPAVAYLRGVYRTCEGKEPLTPCRSLISVWPALFHCVWQGAVGEVQMPPTKPELVTSVPPSFELGPASSHNAANADACALCSCRQQRRVRIARPS